MTLDIIIPLFNKEKNVLNYYNKINDELKTIKHNFIFIDNSSSDKTLDVLKSIYEKDDENIKIISLSKTYDKESAIYEGLLHSKSDLVCIFDFDLQINVSNITKMYEYLIEHNNYDSVCLYTSYIEKNVFKRFKVSLINKIYGLNIDINKTDCRIMRRNVVNEVIKSVNNYFSSYNFDLIGFNTYYLKLENKNHINTKDMYKYMIYAQKPFNLIRIINISLSITLIILLILRLLIIFRAGNTTILFAIIITCITILYSIRFVSRYFNKKNTKLEVFIKEKIGFDDNILWGDIWKILRK